MSACTSSLPLELPIEPLRGPVDFSLAVPGSKSISNRYLVMSALADGDVTLTGLLHSDDTRYMIGALKGLGFEVLVDEAVQTCRVRGGAGSSHPRERSCF